jgi:tetratricopeptide (TPR) repeat protein
MFKCRLAVSLLLTICTLAGLPLSAAAAGAGKARHFDGFAAKNALDAGAMDDDADRSAIGVKFIVRHPIGFGVSKVILLQVVKDSPASHAGLLKDDLILAVDGQEVAGLDAAGIAKLIRGEPGTHLTLTIERKHERTNVDVERGGLRAVTDPEFRTSLTHQYEDEERKQRFTDAQHNLMLATGRGSTFAKASPPLTDAMVVAVCDGCNEARFSIERGDYADAEKRLVGALKRYPNFAEARYLLALLYDLLGRFEESRTQLRMVVAAMPKSLDAWLSLALSEHILGDRAAALKDYKTALKMCSVPKDEKAVRIKITSLQDEIVAQGTATKTAPELVAQARQLIRASDYEQAERVLRQAVAVDSKFSAAWQVLGEVQQKQGDTEEALDSIKNAFDGGDAELAQLIASASHSDASSPEVSSTVEALKKRIAAASPTENINWARIALGYFYTRQSKWDAALEQYKELLSRDTLDPKDRAMLMVGSGVCNEFCGRFADALNVMEKAVQLDPSLTSNKEVNQSITMLREVLRNGGKQSPDAADYISEIRLSDLCRWNTRKPLKVYIATPPTSLATFRPSFDAKMKTAFEKWSAAMGGQIKFVFVPKPNGAQIRCEWTDDRSLLSGSHRLAITRLTWLGHRIQRAQITMLTTTSPERTVALSDDEVYASALHEVGHALGLSAHSANNRDIMFPFNIASGTAQLSERDIRTMTALYALPEPRDAAAPVQFNFSPR